MKKIFLTILFFYLLVLFQSSFLIHFPLKGYILNLTLIVIIFINLFAPHQSWWGVTSAFFGGFFLDIFSENFIGFYILISLGISLFIKFIVKKYVRIPLLRRT